MILTLPENEERDLDLQVHQQEPEDTKPSAQIYEETHDGQRCHGVDPDQDCDWVYTDSDYDEF